MKLRNDAEWEELAQRAPYFPVLGDDGKIDSESGDIATPAFFRTGEEDLVSLLAAITSLVAHPVRLSCALDFGCGAGRLTLPLARRSTRVVACDIAPTMLAHVRENARLAGLENVTVVETRQLSDLHDGQFDFICSLLVFQYIPRAGGYELIRTLLRLLAPGGIAALHVTLQRSGGRLRRLAGAVDGRSRRAAGADDMHPHSTDATTNGFDRDTLGRCIESMDAAVCGRFAMQHADALGEVLVIQKSATAGQAA